MDREVLKVSLAYSVLNIFMHKIFPYSIIQTFVVPVSFVLIYIAIKTRSIRTVGTSILRGIASIGVLVVYQLLVMPIKLDPSKLNQLNATISQCNVVSVLMINLDIIFMLFTISLVGGDLFGRLGRIDTLDSEQESDAQSHDAETLELIAEFDRLSVWRKIRGIVIMIAIQVLQTFCIALICTLNSRLLELCIIAPVFWLSRSILKKAYHSDSIFICTVLSCLIFYFATAISIPLKYSMFSCVIWAVLLSIGMYLAAVHFEDYKILNDDRIRRSSFNVNTCTEIQMRERCRELGKSKEYEDFCVMAFVHKRRRKEIAAELHYEQGTVKRYITKYRRELEGVD